MAMTPELEELMRQHPELRQKYMDAGPEEQSMLERDMAMLAGLPPDLQAEAVANLSADYEGRETTLRDELENNYALLTQEGPQGEVAGNNPYSVYIAASPVEHLASGLQKFDAGKQVKKSREGLEKLSQGKEKGVARVMEGALSQQEPESGMLSWLLRNPDEERKRRPKSGLPWGIGAN